MGYTLFYKTSGKLLTKHRQYIKVLSTRMLLEKKVNGK